MIRHAFWQRNNLSKALGNGKPLFSVFGFVKGNHIGVEGTRPFNWKRRDQHIFASENVRSDISSLAATLQTKLDASPKYSSRRCIYRVPKLMRQANEQAYTPALVSVGPLHHNDERLLPMEVHKVKYLQSFLCSPQSNTAGLLNSCLRKVKEKETEIREYYADPINLSSDEFCEMVLVDSAFIIQVFRKCIYDIRVDDYLDSNPCLKETAFRDVIWLQENQLPFFVLSELYNTAFQTNTTTPNSVESFTNIACEFLRVVYGIHTNDVIETEYLHLLHMVVLHRSFTTIRDLKGNRIKDLTFPSATKLHEAGVKFQLIKDSSTNLLDIKFDNKKWILKMPTLSICDRFEFELRNMVAFEQCNREFIQTRYFTDYRYFLDCLINNPEDVQLLTEAGIIQNLMGSPQQVSKLINSLGTHVATSPNTCYGKIISQLQNHCKKRWPRYRATLMHTYFKHPWAAISVGYATILLILTLIQAWKELSRLLFQFSRSLSKLMNFVSSFLGG